jgi:hypothetical protein
MALFVALLHTRGPRSIAAVREMTVALAIESMKDLGRHPEQLRKVLAALREEEGLDFSEAKAMDALAHFDERFRVSVDAKRAMAESLNLTASVAEELKEMSWSLCVNERALFVTSDTPVCLFVPVGRGEAIFGGGFGRPEAEITLPLSPTVSVLIRRRASQGRMRVGEATVQEFNRRAAHTAEQFVISTLKTKRVADLVGRARRTLEWPKIDKEEFGLVAREALRLFPRE